MWINLLQELPLHLHLILNILYRLLHHPTPIRVFRQTHNLPSNSLIQSLLLLLRPLLEYLLEDIVPKTVLHQGLVLAEYETENELFNVLLASFKDVLNGAGTVLVT